MAARRRIASLSRHDDTVKQPSGDDDNFVQPLDQALQGEVKRQKRRRITRELTRALPDVIDTVLDLVQHL